MNVVADAGHRPDYIRELPEQVRITLRDRSMCAMTSSTWKQLRALDEGNREALVRALEYAWSRINRPGGPPDCSLTVSRRCLGQRARQ